MHHVYIRHYSYFIFRGPYSNVTLVIPRKRKVYKHGADVVRSGTVIVSVQLNHILNMCGNGPGEVQDQRINMIKRIKKSLFHALSSSLSLQVLPHSISPLCSDEVYYLLP